MYAQALTLAAAGLSTLAAASPLVKRVSAAGQQSSLPKYADDVTYGSSSTYNWGGAQVSPPTSGVNFTFATGTYSLESCSNPNNGQAGPWSTAAWVGLDGCTGTPSLFQAGVTCSVDSSGDESYTAWTEWLPAGSNTISDFTLNQGDSVTIELTILSSTSGSIVINDATSGATFTTTMTAPSPTATLDGACAEWIVEDADGSSGLVPFASFSPVSWNEAFATDANNVQTGAIASGFTNITLITSSGSPLTNLQAGSQADEFTVSYV